MLLLAGVHLIWNSIDVLNVLATALVASVFLMVAAISTRGYRQQMRTEMRDGVRDDLREIVDELRLSRDAEEIRAGVARVEALMRLIEGETRSAEDDG